MMCPFCFTTLGLVVAGTLTSGGLAAVAVKISRKKTQATETPTREDKTGPDQASSDHR